MHDLVACIQLPPLPNPMDLTQLLPMPSIYHYPLRSWTFSGTRFVDDNGSCAIWDQIHPALQQSLIVAFILFDWPSED
jgi:hypothetical protein